MNKQSPPKLNLTHTVSTTLRFQCSTAATKTITAADIAGACGTICTILNTSTQPWASSFRIKRVSIFPPSSAAAVETVGIFWQNANGYVRDEIKDVTVPLGMTVPTRVSSSPPKRSLASDWISSTYTGNIMDLTVVDGAVVDLNIDYNITAALNPYAPILINVGVLGNIYYLALDGRASNTITPVALSTTS
jgi:hypothetical protein